MKEPSFWDASALVPLCVYEMTTRAAISYLKKHSLIVWWGCPLEILSAICRLHRQKAVTDEGRDAAIARLETLNRTWKEIPAVDRLRELAFDLLAEYPLKAGDSLQLAAALIWCDERPARRTFVCADQRLSSTARSMGFTVLELFASSSRA